MRQQSPVLLGLLLLGACRSTTLSELSRLAETPPLPYSVLVSGGAFVSGETLPPDAPVLARTWATVPDGMECFPLQTVGDALRQGRVFERVAIDPGAPALRQRATGQPEVFPVDDQELQQLLRTARVEGHDLLLVVDRLRDGPIEEQGVNGQWPLTTAAWLLVALGMFVSDHTYESRALLRLSLRDLQTGHVVYEVPVTGGAVDLSLWERGSFLGLATSILIPPFLVGDHAENVAHEVREIFGRRLLVSVARQLKSFELQQLLKERTPAVCALRRDGNATLLQIEAKEVLGLVRLRLDDQPVGSEEVRAFEGQLLGSLRQDAGSFHYVAPLPALHGGSRLQVLLQTVTGRTTSVTLALGGGT